MTATGRVIMNAEEMEIAIQRIALQILERNSDVSTLCIVGIHTCGVDLAQRIRSAIKVLKGVELSYGSLDITLHRDDWSLHSQNPIVRTTDIPFVVEDSRIILIDDVLFTGRTIRAAMDALVDYGRPQSIQLATLVDRGGRELPIQADYVGLEILVRPNEHIQVLLREHGGDDEVVLQN
ncbi:MAG: bifunctional pyr operon transcriptional regulator/uracil phosphoribosyltransferase PyrR [Desulfobulbaceae bacterium]|uniref:Bifunctional protein PyrR n=1 Tax=Candidatus Desulfatifera sulfidica TaxID=2841691 RepID=A0A8J6N705_9BACT|nr:bifunctional pyr operon transcriptional regulator/uracil phosphoribosyltransferase PyrR [Candidatus Desulfatifera sulfidica]